MGKDFANNHAAITLIFSNWITGIQCISVNSQISFFKNALKTLDELRFQAEVKYCFIYIGVSDPL